MAWSYESSLNNFKYHLGGHDIKNCDHCNQKLFENDDVVINLYHGYIVHKDCLDGYMDAFYGEVNRRAEQEEE